MASEIPQRGNPDLRRRSMYDGFRPADFADPSDDLGWPRGALRNAFLAREFRDRQPNHASPEAERKWRAEAVIAFQAVRELAVLLEELDDWVKAQRRPPKHEELANELNVSRQRLTAVLKGRNFPQWDLPWRIKALISPSGPRKAEQDDGYRRRRRRP